jgi:hypothetical protein
MTGKANLARAKPVYKKKGGGMNTRERFKRRVIELTHVIPAKEYFKKENKCTP